MSQGIWGEEGVGILTGVMVTQMYTTAKTPRTLDLCVLLYIFISQSRKKKESWTNIIAKDLRRRGKKKKKSYIHNS